MSRSINSTNYFIYPDSTALRPAAVTWIMWYRPTLSTQPNNSILGGKLWTTTVGPLTVFSWGFQQDGSNNRRLRFILNNGGANLILIQTGNLTVNAWSAIVGRAAPGSAINLRIYNENTSLFGNFNGGVLGSFVYAAEGLWVGGLVSQVADVGPCMAFDSVLTNAEVEAALFSPLGIGKQPIFYAPMQGEYAAEPDYSGSGAAGLPSLVGAPAASAFNPKVPYPGFFKRGGYFSA